MLTFPTDYLERVYAGVLGKIIGVYLGRPFEGWHYNDIVAKLGDINYYVHDKLGQPLVVSDDDISGTFTFLRAIDDNDYPESLTAAQIGDTWLNYLIEGRTVLWWGGLGNSTEHTAYLRLKSGIPAPQSGSIACNGRVVAEQIGSQIFIDGWGMICPGDPQRAARYAALAASVSHDGAAIHGAQVVAAMEAAAFGEKEIDKLLDIGVAQIPPDCLIARMIGDIRQWAAQEPDWRVTRRRIEAQYGYAAYGGGCHMVPNHALIILALLYGGGDFSRSLMIVNTAGWDTDCNSANVGCLLGIRNGLAGLESGPDWRGPVADRILLPTADAGGGITDAVAEALKIANVGLKLAGKPAIRPKQGARFHFELPGSVHGFTLDAGAAKASISNVSGGSKAGLRSLRIEFAGLESGDQVVATTPTFMNLSEMVMPGYTVMASPTLFPGHTVRARVAAGANGVSVNCALVARRYGAGDEIVAMAGAAASLAPGADSELEWTIPDTDGQPIASIGIAVTSPGHVSGAIHLDYLTWSGVPKVTFTKPAEGGKYWGKAWVNGLSQFETPHWFGSFGVGQNEETGLAISGGRDWRDYCLSAKLSVHLAEAAGIAVRVQGMRRYYAFVLCAGNKARLLKARDGVSVLAECDLPWEADRKYEMSLEASGTKLRALLDGELVFDVEDEERPLTEGAVALVCTEGRFYADWVKIVGTGL